VAVVTERLPHVRSVAAGFWIARGSRNENRRQNGLSHVLEHMAFKGTATRSARDIAHFLESIGGHLDAFTSKEETCFYARALDEHLPQALEITTDLVVRPRLSAQDLERERQVVMEEIKAVDDTPDDLVHDLLAEALFDSHPLSFPVLGTMDNCRRFTPADLKRFWRRHYSPENFVLAAAGRLEHQRVVDLWAGFLENVRPGKSPESYLTPVPACRLVVRKKKTSQAHLCLGFPGLPATDPDRFTLWVLNTVLGGGMSSRLFQRIREQEALAYSVYSYLDFYRDSGLVAVYLGVDKDKVPASLVLTLKEIRRLIKEPLNRDELAHAKAQIKGGMMLGLESVSNRMFRVARTAISGQPFMPLGQTLARIDRITADDISRLAEKLFRPDRLAVSAIGPLPRGRIDLDGLRGML
jgi:predicted Zn-dependent peptidase